MLKNKNFFIPNSFISNSLVPLDFLQRYCFTKGVYTKFLVLATITFPRKKIILLDNYFSEFSINLKKKFRRLRKLFNRKPGAYLKGDLFLYKHSKLRFFFFHSVRLKSYVKKNITKNFDTLNYFTSTASSIILYKNVRGGFLGFSNFVCGYVSKYFLIKSKNKIFRYKKYSVVLNAACAPSKHFSFNTLFFSPVGIIRNFRKKKKKAFKRLFFKRLKVFFFFNNLIVNQLISYLNIIFKSEFFICFKSYFFNLLFSIYKRRYL